MFTQSPQELNSSGTILVNSKSDRSSDMVDCNEIQVVPTNKNSIPINVCAAKEHFKSSGNDIKVLLAMGVGLRDTLSNETVPYPVFMDYTADKRFPSTKKKSWNPSNLDLINEIKRRKKENNDMSRTNKQMTRTDALTWMKDNPISDKKDVDFILKKIVDFMTTVAEASKEKQERKGLSGSTQQWNGIAPFLRLIHSIIDFDDAKAAFQHSFNVMSRDELDGRNSEDIMRTCPWKLVADNWNDITFKPVTTLYMDLHHELARDIDITHSAVEKMGILTADKAKSKFFKLKNELIVVKSNWERSGNGDGSRKDNTVRDSHNPHDDAEEEELFNANDRRNFLNGKSPAVLYLWEKANEHDLLTSVCQKLDCSSSMDSSSASKNNRRANKRHRENESDGELKEVRALMDRSNEAIERSNLLKQGKLKMDLMALIELHEEKMYRLEDEIDNEPEGTRKRERLQRRLQNLEGKVTVCKADLEKICSMLDGGEMQVE